MEKGFHLSMFICSHCPVIYYVLNIIPQTVCNMFYKTNLYFFSSKIYVILMFGNGRSKILCLKDMLSILLNIMFHAPMESFQLEFIYYFTYLRICLPFIFFKYLLIRYFMLVYLFLYLFIHLFVYFWFLFYCEI